MEDWIERFLRSRLVPAPVKAEFPDGPVFRLEDGWALALHSAGGADELAAAAVDLSRRYWRTAPRVTAAADGRDAGIPEEGYRLRIRADRVDLAAPSLSGLRNAFKTLRQLAEAERGSALLTGFLLVPADIEDAPASSFRGIHLCIFPETPLWDIEKSIRLAAYHKFNYAVVECWGVFPFTSHPKFCWQERRLDRGGLERLVKLGRELGITLVPQFNILGHASMARGVTGKHAALDFHPELQPLFEPEGWSWCLSNPAAREVLADLVCELDESFGRPPFFHIGCDEACDLGSCLECRSRPLRDLVGAHLAFFHDLLGKRGARAIMWHDMLLLRSDPRWQGYTAYGADWQGLGELHRDLPKDIVVADWQYGCPEPPPGGAEPDWPTLDFFKEQGFDVLACPWNNERGVESLGRAVERKGLFGMLQTTWHVCHGTDHFASFHKAPCAAWAPRAAQGRCCINPRLAVAHHMRQIGWDMQIRKYEQTGWNQTQVNPGSQWL